MWRCDHEVNCSMLHFSPPPPKVKNPVAPLLDDTSCSQCRNTKVLRIGSIFYALISAGKATCHVRSRPGQTLSAWTPPAVNEKSAKTNTASPLFPQRHCSQLNKTCFRSIAASDIFLSYFDVHVLRQLDAGTVSIFSSPIFSGDVPKAASLFFRETRLPLDTTGTSSTFRLWPFSFFIPFFFHHTLPAPSERIFFLRKDAGHGIQASRPSALQKKRFITAW